MPLLNDEQIERAKSIDVLDYLRLYELNNLKCESATCYTLRDHNSLVVNNGKFYWFSRDVGGYNALDFLLKVRGMSFTDAVLHLTDGTTPPVLERPPPKAETNVRFVFLHNQRYFRIR